jgi:hypothetical protein
VSCRLIVRFAPQAPGGRSAVITVTTSAGTVTIGLAGQAAAAVTPKPVFGLASVKADRSCVTLPTRGHRKLKLSFRLSHKANVSYRIERRAGKAPRSCAARHRRAVPRAKHRHVVTRTVKNVKRGHRSVTVKLSARRRAGAIKVAPGVLRVTLTARRSAGVSRKAVIHVQVRPRRSSGLAGR